MSNTRNRSAVTGQFVTPAKAARSPSTHVRETIKTPSRPSPAPAKKK